MNNTLNNVIKVSIVEDDVRVRDSLSQLIELSDGFHCISQFSTAEMALASLPAAAPDVVVMDINLPGMDGVECVRKLKQLLPRCQILMLTVYDQTDKIFNALAAGANGYLLKQTAPVELLASIRDVHNGGSPMSSHIARKVVQSFQTPARGAGCENLTAREQEVLDYLTKGYMYKEIASLLHISFDTVHTHTRHIYEKLHIRSRTELMTSHLRSP
jgi:DNA-binding NarL/FixJ family response regulator